MLETLKFVQGAVSKKDIVPVLQHFRIKDGTIQGFNGAIALSSPIDLNLSCSPLAAPFIKAIQTCRDTVQLHLTQTKRLAIKSGPFVAFVECLPEDHTFPNIDPEGDDVAVDGELLLKNLKILAPFIAEDASRVWARGILFRGTSAYATNNIVIVEKWLGAEVPELNIPEESVAELLRIGEPPSRIQASQRSITFHFANGRWLRSQVLSTEWPDVSKVLEGEGGYESIPAGFFEALEDLAPFLGQFSRCYFSKDRISTSPNPEIGASVEVKGVPEKGCWNLNQLRLLKRVASTTGFEKYPSPCMFYGTDLRGVIAGMSYE